MGFLDVLLGRPAKVENPRLERTLARLARGDTPEARVAYYRELLRATLILPSPGLEGKKLAMNREIEAHESVSLNLIALDTPDGGKAITSFTSESALVAWRPVGAPYVGMKLRDVAALVLANGTAALVINPAGPAGGLVTREELGYLAEGRSPPTVPGASAERVSGDRLAFRAVPSTEVDGLVTSLRTVCAAEPVVRTAHLARLSVGGAPARLVIALELEPGSPPAEVIPRVLAAFSAAAGVSGVEGLLLDGSAPASEVRAISPPAYVRGR